ncbi:MAG: LegC family aminotransferase [Chitinophagales bacterium]|nr:LegC family aminotransferase [Chitinophagales bacterium]
MENFLKITTFIKALYPGKAFIPLHEPSFFGNEKKYVLDTIETNFVSSVGAYVDRFEEMMRAYTGAKYAIAIVNGTSALHMSLMLAGVQQDDLVITQALSFIATCNAISYIGASPAFVDVDEERLGMSVASLAQFLSQVTLQNGIPIHIPSGKRIGACVPMHTFGMPVAIDEIIALCNQYNIPVIEDAAESLGTIYKGKHTGTYGLLGTYSFNGNKTITCGGGGIIVTDDEILAKRAKHLTTQAKVPHSWEFNHDAIGYNYRCPNLNAALACAQLEQLESIIENKRATSNIYEDFFRETPYKLLREPDNTRANYWLNAIFLQDRAERDAFLEFANKNGVMTRPIWTLMNKLPMFKDCYTQSLENSIKIENTLVNIPSSYREQGS